MASILAAHMIAETARDAVFLQQVPTRWLALVYVALASLAYVGLRGNAALTRRLGRQHALVATLMVAAFGTALFYVVRVGASVAFALYLWTGLLGTVSVVQFWMLAASHFTSGEAKRLFGLVAALGALGALVGALLATVLLAVIRVEQLLPVAAGFYVIAGLVLTHLPEPEIPLTERTARPHTGRGPVRMRDHPYVLRLVVLGVLATAAAVVSDYLMKTTAASHFDPDELPAFFARYHSAVSTLSLALQLVGASLLLRKVGVLGAVVVLPATLLIGGSIALLTAGVFIVIALTKGADATLRHSVHRVASELLWMPVSDGVRAAIRELFEGVGGRVVQAVVALTLFGLTVAEVGTPMVMTAILVGIAALWLVVAVGMRTSYLAQLRSALVRPQFPAETELDLASIEIVVEALSSTEDRRVIAAVKVLQAHGRAKLIPALLLRHDSPEVLVVALDAIAVPGRTDWVPLTRTLVTAGQPAVRIAAIRALARHGHRDAVQEAFFDSDPAVRASAVFWETQTSNARDLLQVTSAAALLEADDADGGTVRRVLVEAVRDDGDPRWVDVLLALARYDDPALVPPLARAIERLPDERFIPFLVARLGTRAGRSDVRAALVAIGDPALEALGRALDDLSLPSRVRLHVPMTIAAIGTQRAGDILAARLAHEKSGAARYRLLSAIARLALREEVRFSPALLRAELVHHVREHFRLLGLFVAIEARGPASQEPAERTNAGATDLEHATRDGARLLRGVLLDKISQARDRMFLVLQALHPREDVRGIERAFGSPDRTVRAHALEFLDTLTRAAVNGDPESASIRDAILVAYEELPPAEQVRRMVTMADPPATGGEAVTRMLHDADSLLAACAAYHALQDGTTVLADRVREVARERPLLAPLGLQVLGATP